MVSLYYRGGASFFGDAPVGGFGLFEVDLNVAGMTIETGRVYVLRTFETKTDFS
jgi:hypothetical protein